MPFEDFSVAVETDPNSRITKTTRRVTWAGLNRNESAHVSIDKGVDFFSADFVIEMRIKISASNSGIFAQVWTMANVVGNWEAMRLASEDGLSIQHDLRFGTDPRLTVREMDGGAEFGGGFYKFVLGTVYYLKIVL